MQSGFKKENDDINNILSGMHPDDVIPVQDWKGGDPRNPKVSMVVSQEEIIPEFEVENFGEMPKNEPVQKPPQENPSKGRVVRIVRK